MRCSWTEQDPLSLYTMGYYSFFIQITSRTSTHYTLHQPLTQHYQTRMYSTNSNTIGRMLLLFLATSVLAQSTTTSPTFDAPSLYVVNCTTGMPAGMCQYIYHLGCDQTGMLVNAAPVSDDQGDCSSASCSCIPFIDSLCAGSDDCGVTIHPWSSTMTLEASGTPAAEIDPAFSSIQSFISLAGSGIVVNASPPLMETINFSRVSISMPRIKTGNVTRTYSHSHPRSTTRNATRTPHFTGSIHFSRTMVTRTRKTTTTHETSRTEPASLSSSLSAFVGVSPFTSRTTRTKDSPPETFTLSLSGFVGISPFPSPTPKTFLTGTSLRVVMTSSKPRVTASQSSST